MRFLLYNIRYGAGVGPKFHLPVPYCGYLKPTNGHFSKIMEFIKSVGPDIVGLVEVDFGSYRVEKCNQAEVIADRLDHRVVYESKYSAQSMARKIPLMNKQGNAILTNLEIVNQRFHFFNNGVKRLVIEVELPELSIFLVHLSLKFRHRQYQLNQLHRLITKQDKPVIVAGDFNAFWGDRELELFLAASGMVSANMHCESSFPSNFPVRELDFIFHSPEIRSIGFEVPHVKLSDHLPLLWDFDIQPKEPAVPFARSTDAARGMVAPLDISSI